MDRPALKVLVIGAGVAGLVAATTLAERGACVTVIDRDDPATRASYIAGGMLAPWCEAADAPPEIIATGADAIIWWTHHVPATQRQGSLVLAPRRDAGELARFARRTTQHEMLDTSQLALLEPDVASQFDRALFFRNEAHLDPRAALAALRLGLADLGVPIQIGEADPDRVSGYDHVVDCRGYAAASALPELRGVRGEMLMLRCPDMKLRRPVRLLHPRIPIYVVPRGDGQFMVGATMIESADRRGITVRSAMELLNAVYTLHPAFGEAEILETGSNIRPAFSDNMPAISNEGRILRMNGMYRHGFLLAPHFAARMADMVLGPQTIAAGDFA